MATEQFKKEQVAFHEPRFGRAASPLAAVGAQRTARPTCGAWFMFPVQFRKEQAAFPEFGPGR